MLKLLPTLPKRAVDDAVDMASSCFDVEGDDRDFSVSRHPIAIYVASPDPTTAAYYPTGFVPNGFALAALEESKDGIAGWVTLAQIGRRLEAVVFEFVEAGSYEERALALADTSADRPGEREIRMVDIPWLHARFFWVTGDEPQFVDRMNPKVYDEAGFVAEMGRRLDSLRPSSDTVACALPAEDPGC